MKRATTAEMAKIKQSALKHMKAGILTPGKLKVAICEDGFSHLPANVTLYKWADDAGYKLRRASSWSNEHKKFALDLLRKGVKMSTIRKRMLEKYGRQPAVSTIYGWDGQHAALGVWEVAELLVASRNGVDNPQTLHRLHAKLKASGHGHLCKRITAEKGMDLWEVGKFLEDQGCDQVAIDTALLAVFSNVDAHFLKTARTCMRRKEAKSSRAKREEAAIVRQLEEEYHMGLAA
ncbi:MAG: hypothetical protein AAF564_17815 [Bacteroidota bacterium]